MSDSEDSPTVPIVCDACGTTSRIPVDDVAESLERHNDQLHDGEEIAQIDPDIAAELQDIVAEDLGLLE